MQVKSFKTVMPTAIIVILMLGRGYGVHAEQVSTSEAVGTAPAILNIPVSNFATSSQRSSAFRPLALRDTHSSSNPAPGTVYVNGADHFNFITFSTPKQMLIGGDQVRIPLNAIFGRIACQVQWEPQLESLTGFQKSSTPITTEGVHFRFSAPTIKADRRTSLTNYLTIGQNYDSDTGRNVETTYATVALNHQLAKQASIALKYTYRDDPRGQDLTARPGYVDTFEPWAGHAVQSRVSLDFAATTSQKIKLFVSAGNNLTFEDHNIYTSVTCPVGKDWGMGISNSRHFYARMNAERTEFWVARRFMGRSLLLAYSTQTKKYRVDLVDIKF